jgi:hypothetical protein
VVLQALHDEAEEQAGDDQDERWDVVAADDKALKKRLQEARAARVQAEYLRLRGEIIDAIQAWFLQRRLVAAGADPALLPHPEFLEAAAGSDSPAPAVTVEEADADIAGATQLVRCLSANVNERLALEAFCLAVTEKT